MQPKDSEVALADWLLSQQRVERLRLGVCFRNLGCHGFTSSAEVQDTALSYLLVVPQFLLRYVFRQPQTRVQILSGFDGVVLPGEMLLVLGRPGSGCSSFLKVLSGDTHGIRVDGKSQVTYSGVSFQQMHRDFKGESVYLAELDAHFAELSLGQTLAFASLAKEAGKERVSVAQDTCRDIAVLFGLENAFNTQIGNAMIRGISGGEKRRTSIAEALMNLSQFQCWDNSTRGLDSSTARRFIELLRKSTDALQSTTIMSVYQASEAMYKNFDKVTLLYEGRQIYFGPAESAAAYFHDLGFERPSRATTADFLTSITSPAERVIRRGYQGRTPSHPDDFAAAWKESAEAKNLAIEVETYERAHLCEGSNRDAAAMSDRSKPVQQMLNLRSSTYPISIRRQITICLLRGFQRLRNNLAPTVSTVLANAILAIVVGTVFYDLPEDSESMQKRAVLIFFSLMICAFSPAFEVLAMWAQRPIVEKHNRYAMYHPVADGVASFLCDIPAKISTTILFHVTLYFMTNLRRTASAFFTHVLFMFFVVLTMSMLFRTLGSLSRTLEQTTAPASTVVLLSIIYTGFVIPTPYMKPWLSWFRYVNPMAYVYESLMINEAVPSGPSYSAQADMNGKVCPVVGAEPGEPDVQGSAYLYLKYGYEPAHSWRNFAILLAMMVIFCSAHLLAAQYVPAQRSKGEILLYKRGRSKKKLPPEADAEKATVAPVFAQDVHKQHGVVAADDKFPRAAQKSLQNSSIFHWNHLSYEIKAKGQTRKILNDISGWVRPGTLTALMGPTGAGKTTLLDTLANRATFGSASGNVYIDDKLRDATFQRRIGYVQQDDVHLPTANVRETLEFSARLRQPASRSKEDITNCVHEVIEVLEMQSYADAIVGIPGSGLNIEQRKRLSIGVELVAKPELLLFLDEPTSGLDSQTAWSICMLLRKLADQGQAVLCTIHQPSSQIFQTFDRLLLLSDSGQTVYFGEIGQGASHLIRYFEQGGAPECPTHANPAEWALEMTRRSPSPEHVDWSQKWHVSQQCREVQQYLEQLLVADSPSNVESIATQWQGGEYAASILRQFSLVTRRIFRDYWRDPTYLYSKLGLCVGVGFFNGISFYDTPLDMQGFINFLFSIFLLSQLFSTLDQQIIPRLIANRELFETREQRSKSYAWTVFLAANITVEVFWQTFATVLIFVSWYYTTLLWQNHDSGRLERGGLVFVLVWLFCLWITTFSQAIGVAIEHAETAVQLATLCFWLSLVFCGVLVSPKDIPRFWKFVYRVSPLTYLINGLAQGTLGDTHTHCSDVELLHIDPPHAPSANESGISNSTCGHYLGPFVRYAGGLIENPAATEDCRYCPVNETNDLLEQLGIELGQAWRNVGYMFVYVVFNVAAMYAIYWLARVPKGKRRSG